MIFSCIIVDDDVLAITNLKRHLANFNNVKIVNTFTKGLDALAFLKQNKVDFAFFDIIITTIDGIELASKIENSCKIIFTTIDTKFALDAYNVDAIDYLLKPIVSERLEKAIHKVINYIHAEKIINHLDNSDKIDKKSQSQLIEKLITFH